MIKYNHKALRDLRKKKGMTVEQLSVGSKVSYSRLCKFESKDNFQNPNIQTLIAICNALDVSITAFIE